MVNLSLSSATGDRLKLLCVGAHSDDIEIGCGATVLQLLGCGRPVEVLWTVFSAHGQRAEEARRSAHRFLEGAACTEVRVHGFRDGFLPWQGAEVKERVEDLKAFEPDVVLTHRREDRHQDHRLVSDLCWNTFRQHLILEYEIPKYDGDLGCPNVFVPVSDELRERKVALLESEFGTQRSKRWFTRETFEGLMRLRGVECASPTGYAEAFHGRKLVLA